MRFVYEDGFDLEPGKAREFRQWLATNEPKLRGACPKGVVYLGVLAVVHTTAKGAGDVRIRWGMETYGALDALEAALSEPGLLAQLLTEMRRFEDYRGRWDRDGRTLLSSLSRASSSDVVVDDEARRRRLAS